MALKTESNKEVKVRLGATRVTYRFRFQKNKTDPVSSKSNEFQADSDSESKKYRKDLVCEGS